MLELELPRLIDLDLPLCSFRVCDDVLAQESFAQTLLKMMELASEAQSVMVPIQEMSLTLIFQGSEFSLGSRTLGQMSVQLCGGVLNVDAPPLPARPYQQEGLV